MPQYITRRLLLAVVTLIGAWWLIFFIMWIIFCRSDIMPI
jgi:hypothetical protein